MVSAWLSSDGHYAFAEFSTVEECNAAMTYLNGLQMGSSQLKVGRPSGFKATPNMDTSVGGMGLRSGGLGTLTGMLGTTGPGAFTGGLGSVFNPQALASGKVVPPEKMEIKPEHRNVIMMHNIPSVLDEPHLRELVSPFGEVSLFNFCV